MLETILTDLTAAVRELTAAINASRGTPSVPNIPETIAPEAEKKTRKGKATAAPVAETTTITPEVVAPVAKTKEDHEKEAEPVIQELLNKGKKEQILALNKKYAVARFREICGTDKFDAYMTEAKSLLAA